MHFVFFGPQGEYGKALEPSSRALAVLEQAFKPEDRLVLDARKRKARIIRYQVRREGIVVTIGESFVVARLRRSFMSCTSARCFCLYTTVATPTSTIRVSRVQWNNSRGSTARCTQDGFLPSMSWRVNFEVFGFPCRTRTNRRNELKRGKLDLLRADSQNILRQTPGLVSR